MSLINAILGERYTSIFTTLILLHFLLDDIWLDQVLPDRTTLTP